MPLGEKVNSGKIDWTGENPGILLKEDPDGPWSAMALFFRIAYSPKGRGQALLLFEAPDVDESLPNVRNVLMTDNEPLARYLQDTFISKLAAFGGAPAYKALQVLPMEEVRTEGDPRSCYSEIVRGGGLTVELIWDELGAPQLLELPPEETGPKDREMITILVESRKASIVLNGKALPGTIAPRVQAGIETTTAFLYFSETWIWPASS